MEVTIISAQGLKNTSSGPFSNRLRPFITITTYLPNPSNGKKFCHVYTTTVDDGGGVNPTWGDKFYIPVDNTFFANRYSCLCLQLYTKRLIMGRVQLGWCQIPVADIGFPAEGSIRHLSYRMRDRDGTRGNGIVNIAIRLTGFLPVVAGPRLLDSDQKEAKSCHTVIGIPVAVFSRMSIC